MYTHKECYKILQINRDISWNEFRKSYKRLIQKWHPDRFTDKVKKKSAEDKIKELNIAFEQLSLFYKKNGVFPSIESPLEPPVSPQNRSDNTPVVTGDSVADSVYTNTNEHKVKSSHNNKQNDVIAKPDNKGARLLTIVILLGVITYTLIINESDEIKPYSLPSDKTAETERDRTSLQEKTLEPVEPEYQNQVKIEADPLPDASPKYFTYGSTVGEVLSIQGQPDYVEDDFWFYGDSYIEFENGVVKDWKRTANNPLKANIDI